MDDIEYFYARQAIGRIVAHLWRCVMKDRTLALLGTGGIPYRKELREYAGSVTGSLLMMQLDYWFCRHPDGFYKFLDPTPKHPDYREGDSWTEELGFSKAEFRTAFDVIGIRHLSKSAYVKALDKFAGKDGEKFYASYHDKKNGLTWYFRNHLKVEELIAELCKAKPAKHRVKQSVVDKQPNFTVNQDSESPVDKESESTGDVVSGFIEVNKVDLHKSTNLIYIDSESESTFYIQKLSSEINSETTHKSVEGKVSNSNSKDLNLESIAPLSTKPESSDKQTNSLEGNFSAAARALNRNKADDYFNSPREFNSVKGTYKSASVDPWMASAHNPDKGFSEWLFSKRYKDKSSGTLADAKQEIRNNWERASDLWEEYQSELLKKEQRIEVNATIPIEPFKPQQNPGHRMTEEARNAFRQKLASK